MDLSSLASSRFYPWVIFSFFLAGLSLLSYGQLSLQGQLWAGLFGLLLPFVIGLSNSLQSRQKPIRSNSFKTTNLTLPFGFVLFFGALFLFIRFYHLDSVPFWPISDESVFSTLAAVLTKKWNWSMLCTDGQMEPLLLWLLSFFYKAADPSLFSLHLFTVLISIGATGAAYLAARIFWDRSFSFIFTTLFSFSFWEIGLSRQCTPNDLIPFFELAAFFLLGLYWKASNDQAQWTWLSSLALCCGLGFYAFINWAVVWLIVALYLLLIDIRKNLSKFAVFLLISLGMDLPLLLARLDPKSLSYLQHCSHNTNLVLSTFQYLKGLFWNGWSSYPLGPVWGGYFDAVTGALILLGCLYAVRHLLSKTLWVLAGSIFVCLLPGLLTNSLELQRVTPALPFFIFLATLGVKYLLEGQPKSFQLTAVASLILFIAALNTYQLFVPGNDPQLAPTGRHWRSVNYSTAYQLLAHLNAQAGPIYVFNEWNGDLFDRTLELACYPFDAVQNPNAAAKKPAWVAFLTDKDYAPFLKKRFPNLQFGVIDPKDPNYLLSLFLIPAADVPEKDLRTWLAADQDCRMIALSILNKNAWVSWSTFENNYSQLAIKYSTDPFLVSVLLEKAASFLLMEQNYPRAVIDLQKAERNGYPTAHLEKNLKLAAVLSSKK